MLAQARIGPHPAADPDAEAALHGGPGGAVQPCIQAPGWWLGRDMPLATCTCAWGSRDSWLVGVMPCSGCSNGCSLGTPGLESCPACCVQAQSGLCLRTHAQPALPGSTHMTLSHVCTCCATRPVLAVSKLTDHQTVPCKCWRWACSCIVNWPAEVSDGQVPTVPQDLQLHASLQGNLCAPQHVSKPLALLLIIEPAYGAMKHATCSLRSHLQFEDQKAYPSPGQSCPPLGTAGRPRPLCSPAPA